MINILTIDVEDWYTSSLALFDAPLTAYGQRPSELVIYNTRKILEILRDCNCKATFFVLATVAEHYPYLVKEIHNEGHEIATHGYSHKLVYQMTPIEFEEDLLKSVDLIENIINEKVIGYRAPYFSIVKKSLWALDILIKHGIKYDASIFPIKRYLYGIPDFSRFISVVKSKEKYHFREVPPSSVRIFNRNFPIGGGGYFRILPYWFIKWGIKKLNKNGHPAVIYMHPYEIDPEDIKMPYKSLSRKIRLTLFTQRIGRNKYIYKANKLFRDFRFNSIKENLKL